MICDDESVRSKLFFRPVSSLVSRIEARVVIEDWRLEYNAVRPHKSPGLETPLACGDCGTMLAPDAEVSPFAVVGIELRYAVDTAEVTKRVRKIARLVHPAPREGEDATVGVVPLHAVLDLRDGDHICVPPSPASPH